VAIDLSLDQDQQLLQTSAAELFARRNPPEVVRDLEASERGYSPELWGEMADLHWLGITIPEEYGGTAGSFLDLYPLCEEMGRHLVPSPFLDTAAVAAPLLLAVGSDAQRRELLPEIAAGREIVAVAVAEPDGGFGARAITGTTATRRGDGWLLNGVKLLVAFASSADHFLVAARTGGERGAEGITVFLVDATAPGVAIDALPNIAGLPLGAVLMVDVELGADTVVGEVGAGWEPLSTAMRNAAVLQTATIVGAAHAVLAMTNQYAKDREQFGNPIGRYQAVQYMVTDVLFDLHRADLLARQAAFRIATDRPSAREACIAVAFGKRAAAHLHRQAHEVHAGVAFMLEHDLTLYSRRSKFWENHLGDARYYEDELGAILV
jgi:alkylation response protein AidB-like acyl-CoA dehydrogenase